MKARFALSTAMCIRKSLAARQESRGLMSSFTAWEKASASSMLAGFPAATASAVLARRGTGPATPKATRARSTVFLSAERRTLTEVPRVAISMALRMAYLM